MTPLDVVKIRLQAQRTPFSKGNLAQGWLKPERLVSSLQGCLSWHSWWQGCLCSAVWGHCEVAGYHGPLVLTGSGALLGELGSCLALSFPLCSPVLRGSALCLAAPQRLSLLQLLALPPLPLFQSPCCSPWALPLPMGSVVWGWPQGTGLVTIGTAWGVAVGACSPLTHRALPVPGWELQHTRVPQPHRGWWHGPCVAAQCVPIVCFSVGSAVSALGRSTGHM